MNRARSSGVGSSAALRRRREIFSAGKVRPVVDDDGPEAGEVRHGCDGLGDVAGAAQDKNGNGQWLHEHLHFSTAQETAVLRQGELEEPRSLGDEDFPGRLADVGLEATTAHGAGDRAIDADEHLHGLLARAGPPHADHGREGGRFAAPTQVGDEIEEVGHR